MLLVLSITPSLDMMIVHVFIEYTEYPATTINFTQSFVTNCLFK